MLQVFNTNEEFCPALQIELLISDSAFDKFYVLMLLCFGHKVRAL